MKIIINGEEKFLDRAISINSLISNLELDPTRIAIEKNLEIVPCSEHGSVMLADGDKIEIVQFIGGG